MVKTRSEELRDRHRRILAWSLFVAVALHAAVLLWTPEFHTRFGTDTHVPPESMTDRIDAPVFVELLFGPPTISVDDGLTWTEPPERVLHASRVVQLPPDCDGLSTDGRRSLTGRVHLRVWASGHVTVVDLPEGTRDPCGDQVLKTVVGDLLYEWLPNDRFPAPVELVQPVALSEVDG